MLKKLNQFLSNEFTASKKEKWKNRHSATADFHTFDFIALMQSWPHIVGELLAKYSLPQKIYRKTLYIAVNHQAYAHELNFMADQIQNKIITHYPNARHHIQRLKFVYSESSFQQLQERLTKTPSARSPQARPKLHPQSPKYLTLKKQAQQFFHDLPDSEYKDQLISLYIQNRLQ